MSNPTKPIEEWETEFYNELIDLFDGNTWKVEHVFEAVQSLLATAISKERDRLRKEIAGMKTGVDYADPDFAFDHGYNDALDDILALLTNSDVKEEQSDTKRYYSSQPLFKRLKELGLPSGKMWLIREERAGRIKARRTAKGWRLFTKQDIDEIVTAYSPGGSGYWYFSDVKENK